MTESSAANLALSARASASESFEDYTPDKVVDGKTETRWSTVPRHVEGNWLQLDWPEPVTVGEVIIQQYDRYCTAFELQVREPDRPGWRTVQKLGEPNLLLPLVVVCRFDPVEISGLRISRIAGGCSICEIEAHAKSFTGYSPEVTVASDLRGGFIGMVTDPWGVSPMEGAEVSLAGTSGGGPWKRSARTDAKGLFRAEMPLGMAGPITVAARLKDPAAPASNNATLDSATFQYGLTPKGNGAPVVRLDGKWQFSVDPPDGFWKTDFDDADWGDIAVPAHWTMQGYTSLSGIGGYRRMFRAPDGEGRVKLRFEGVYSGAEVWVNGRRLAYHEGGATPFEVDVTDAVRQGENLLALRVSEKTFTSTDLDKMSYYAGFPLAGIWRSAYVFRVPDAHVASLELQTSFEQNGKNSVLSGRVVLTNESDSDAENLKIGFKLADPAGRPVDITSPALNASVPAWQRREKTFSINVPSPRKWDAEHPNLYTLTVEVKNGRSSLQSVEQRVGFRTVNVRGTEIHINGVPVKFRGTCHHDQDPLLGRAVTPEIERKDLLLIREANLNALRTSHYPPLPQLLDFADELGVYVESEASMCWVAGSDDLRNTPRIIQLGAELLARDRNHPSIFMWSVCNESHYGYGLARCYEWMKAADPTRPVTASGTAHLDIATAHNPITTPAVEQFDRSGTLPVIWDESFAVFQGIFGEVAEMWVDPGMRDYYVEPFVEVYDRFINSKVVQGSMIWCWADDLFCVPNRSMEYGRVTTFSHFVDEQYRVPRRGIVGDAPWGLVDGWRRRKPEFWINKKLQSPIRVREDALALPEAGQPIRVPVTNHYDFTDLSELRIRWQIGDQSGTATASVPARSQGEITIEPPAAPLAGEELGLTFTDSSGLLVDAFRIPLGEARHESPGFRPVGPGTLIVQDEDMMSGYGKRIIGKEFEVAISVGAWGMGSGFLRRNVVLGQPMLLELPTLHITKLETPLRPVPDVLEWNLRDMDVQAEGANVRARLSGSYEDFDGACEVLITPAGEVTVHSKFAYTGEKDLSAREVGLRFSVPRSCDTVSWDRRAEWHVYPADHIGRPRGEARAFADHTDGAPPSWEWSADNTPMGTNDFRSTRRNINWAGISYPDGLGVLISSDGSQNVRAIVETDRISVHVTDFYGGSNVGRWRPSDLICFSANYGTGKLIKKGDVLESTVRLQFGTFGK